MPGDVGHRDTRMTALAIVAAAGILASLMTQPSAQMWAGPRAAFLTVLRALAFAVIVRWLFSA